jgi:hypothetical protein
MYRSICSSTNHKHAAVIYAKGKYRTKAGMIDMHLPPPSLGQSTEAAEMPDLDDASGLLIGCTCAKGLEIGKSAAQKESSSDLQR